MAQSKLLEVFQPSKESKERERAAAARARAKDRRASMGEDDDVDALPRWVADQLGDPLGVGAVRDRRIAR